MAGKDLDKQSEKAQNVLERLIISRDYRPL